MAEGNVSKSSIVTQLVEFRDASLRQRATEAAKNS